MTVYWFNMHVCHETAIGQVNFDIEEVDAEIVTETIQFFHGIFMFLFSISPYKEGTIYILNQTNYCNVSIFM